MFPSLITQFHRFLQKYRRRESSVLKNKTVHKEISYYFSISKKVAISFVQMSQSIEKLVPINICIPLSALQREEIYI